jgi:virulence-associated protein VapD
LAVWQVLAIVTAQKFLSDINKRLASIERGISDLKQWLEQERLGRLQGSLTYLKQLAEVAQRRDLTETDAMVFASQLESIERESQQVMASTEMPLEQGLAEFKKMALTGMGLEEHSRAAQEQVLTFERRAKEFYLAAFVRGAAIQVRSALPLARGVARLRLDALGEDLQRQAERQRAFIDTVSARVPELKGAWWSWDSTNEEHQQGLRGLFHRAERNLAEDNQSLDETVRTLKVRFQAELDAGDEPLEFVATLDAAGALIRLERVLQA